ncbi:MAG: NAD-dependent epimerase/dehydratase family protein, partial [Sciscionella sp.]
MTSVNTVLTKPGSAPGDEYSRGYRIPLSGSSPMPPNSVLITGVNGPLGARLAAELVADPSIERVIGVDDTEPDDAVRGLMGRAEFRRIDIRNPAIVTVLNSGKVDTVVHVALTSQPVVGVSRTVHKEKNVIGTMQLLAACQQAPTVGNLVVKSGSGVYGPHQRAASVCTEEMVVPAAQLSGYARDAADVEGYVRGFARRHPDTSVSVFRFANLIGPCLDTVMSRYFALPMLPTV